MVIYEKNKPYTKRVPTVTDVTEDIQRFDLDNLYPQRALELVGRSYTLNAVVNRVADFLNGEGFEDPAIASLVVNRKGIKGMTMNDVLLNESQPASSFKTIVLHIGYNLNYRISSITPVEFEYIRLGLPDESGCVKKLKYSTNWERDGRKETRVDREVITYDVFNPDPEAIKQQMIEAGGILNYKGQILYATPIEGRYPKASFDPVFDDASTQAELGLYKVGNVQNSFLASLAIIYSGEFESDKERDEFRALIENKSGARNAGSRIGMQDKSGTKKASDIFQVLTPANLDKLFENTEKTVKDAIMENEAIPKELIGVRPESGMFNQDNMVNAYTYFNAITRGRRARISRIFSTLLEYWETPIMNECKIKEQAYINGPTTGIPETGSMATLTQKQYRDIESAKNRYRKGTYTREIAEQTLRQYGLPDDIIKLHLDAVDQSKAEEGV